MSSSISKLLQSVRELTSGLALPEIDLDMELTSGLVNSTVGITEETVMRRVVQKFGLLRVRVLRDYMGPFARGVIEDEPSGGGGGRVI